MNPESVNDMLVEGRQSFDFVNMKLTKQSMDDIMAQKMKVVMFGPDAYNARVKPTDDTINQTRRWQNRSKY